ncbi:hypothetical protein [Chryseobacterium mucoviscidosis]|uniref:hypothetical protein n=1 Tax=Chryseobacterium mucoviscidosis TaxID=1945581 RepID=UPI000EDC9A4F|nr:hypothetical protein [Chryseobacterium sp.]
MKKSLFIISAFALLSVSNIKAQSTLIADNLSAGSQFTSTFNPDLTKIASFQDEPATSNGVFIHHSGSTTMGDKNTENSKALLELSSSNKGFLPTRLTTDQIDALGAATSEAGMMVYDTTKKCLSIFDGTKWNCAGGAGGGAVNVKYKILEGNTYNANDNQQGSGPYIVQEDDYVIEWQAKSTNSLDYNYSTGKLTPYTYPLEINLAANFILPNPSTCKGRQLVIYNTSYDANYPSGKYTYIWTNYPIYNTLNSGQFPYGKPATTNYKIMWGVDYNKVTITSNGTYWVSDNYSN